LKVIEANLMVGIYLTGVTILKQMAMSFMAPIETNGVSSKQSSHHCGKRDCAGSKKKMGMIWKKYLSIAR